MVKISIPVIALVMVGCTPKQVINPEPTIITKEVQVEVCKDPYAGIKRPTPELAIHNLNKNSTDSEVSAAYVETVDTLMSEVKFYQSLTNQR